MHNSTRLRANLIRVAQSLPKGSSERKAILQTLLAESKTAGSKTAIKLPNEGQDNSWGAGFYPLPENLHHLARFADIFRAPLEHKVFPQTNTHMLTVPASTKLSILGPDLLTLIRTMGLVRIQVNEPGSISFYFQAGNGEDIRPVQSAG